MDSIPFEVKTTFDRSAALDTHIAERLEAAFRAYGHYIRRVDVRLTDVNGPRRGAQDKVTSIEVSVRPSGKLLATGAASDLYLSVTRAAARVRRALAHHVTRLEQRGRRRPRGGAPAEAV